MFELHLQLQQDTVVVGQFPLSLLLLSKDANYPWYILVPRREEVTEIYHLDDMDRQQLLHESCVLAESMTDIFSPDKMNIAALGNVVPQRHLHHIARFRNDPAWPDPIWGAVPAVNYDSVSLDDRLQHMRRVLVGQEFVLI